MNNLVYICNEIINSIPMEILQEAFNLDTPSDMVRATSLEDKIIRKLLKPRILRTMDIIGGIEWTVPLSDAQLTASDLYYTTYFIPPEAVRNKEIISVLSLTSLPGGSYFNPENYGTGGLGLINQPNPVVNVGSRIGSAAAPSGAYFNAHTEIVGYNTVCVYQNFRLLSQLGLLVVLENNSNLNNIQPRSLPAVAKYAILGTKAYIYNKLIIPLNNGLIHFGQDLGVFRSIVESYSDAEEQFNLYRQEALAAVLFMNDTTRYNRFLRSMLAPDL